MAELGFGSSAATIPVADCGPGEELQCDTGWMTYLEPDLCGKRRRFRAWIFTSVLTRHRFAYPVFPETTRTAIEACEAARFGGQGARSLGFGLFKVAHGTAQCSPETEF
jgi:hypothetical protein